MGDFTRWLLAEENQEYVTVTDVGHAKTLSQSDGLDPDDIHFDRIDSGLRDGKQVWYVEQFPLAYLNRRNQGWERGHVLKMLGVLAQKTNQKQPASLEEAQNMKLREPEFRRMVPPVIISYLPDESYHIEDGNHRVGAAIVLKFQNVRAFVIAG